VETNEFQYAVEPIFFGPTSKELFGCYHQPKRVPARSCGIILCNPIEQEYILTHRTFYQLAVKLSNLGFHVLRFDYSGCGDSAGQFEDGSLQQWVDDIQTAARTMMERTHQSRIALLGLRMGAYLALRAATQGNVFDTLVLWEPVLDGRCHIEELAERHKSFGRRMRNKKKWMSGASAEALGFPLTNALRKELADIQADIRIDSNKRLLVVGINPEGTCSAELGRFLSINDQAEVEVIDDCRVWCEELFKRMIPVATMNHMLNWFDKVYP